MARVVVVFEDVPSPDPAIQDGIMVHIESADPPLPLKNGDLDVEVSTPAQSAARLALSEVMDTAAISTLLTQER